MGDVAAACVAGPDGVGADGEARDVVARVDRRGDATPRRVEMLERAGFGSHPETVRCGDHARLAERVARNPSRCLFDDVESRIDRDQLGKAVVSPADDPDRVLARRDAERDAADLDRANDLSGCEVDA